MICVCVCVCVCVCLCVCVCVCVCVCTCDFNFLVAIAVQREASLKTWEMLLNDDWTAGSLANGECCKIDLVCYIWKGLLVNQFRYIDVKNLTILLIGIPFYVKTLVFLMLLWFNMIIYNGGIIYFLHNFLTRF